MSEQKISPPPSGLDMAKITTGLTVYSLIAAILLGTFFYITEPIKIKNLQARELNTIRALLGLTESSSIEEVRQYLSWKDNRLEVIYLTPKALLRFDDGGQLVANIPSTLSPEIPREEKDLWVKGEIAKAGRSDIKFSGRFFVGIENNQKAGYVIEGGSVGYKAHIRFFVAINKAFGVRGVEILEQEEDPGLGAEISQKYFKNQFAGRTAEEIEQLQVIKEPLPNEWKQQLDRLGEISFEAWSEQNQTLLAQNKKVYAITGATISSDYVTTGVQKTLRNFQKRMSVLGEYL